MQAPRGGTFLRKRKEREHGYYRPSSSWTTTPSEQASRMPPPPFFAKPGPRASKPDRPAVARPGTSTKPATAAAVPPPADAAKGAAGNKLLAGCLAHEFRTYGTVLGEPWSAPSPNPNEEPSAPASSPSERYAEVSRLIMEGGARVPGIVNPSQLGGWVGIKK